METDKENALWEDIMQEREYREDVNEFYNKWEAQYGSSEGVE